MADASVVVIALVIVGVIGLAMQYAIIKAAVFNGMIKSSAVMASNKMPRTRSGDLATVADILLGKVRPEQPQPQQDSKLCCGARLALVPIPPNSV